MDKFFRSTSVSASVVKPDYGTATSQLDGNTSHISVRARSFIKE